jgi:membrane-bound acyltransferase YfiQ involved in biofilm formation
MFTMFLFHNARFFNEDDWHVKNFQLDFGMSVVVAILDRFIMPLFFVLSAFAIYYALKKRSNSEFMRERVTRLLIPLGIGIFTHIILQVYIERITHRDWLFHPGLAVGDFPKIPVPGRDIFYRDYGFVGFHRKTSQCPAVFVWDEGIATCFWQTSSPGVYDVS